MQSRRPTGNAVAEKSAFVTEEHEDYSHIVHVQSLQELGEGSG
jgi:hypothetical protein